MPEADLERLHIALDDLKDLWQRGEHHKLAGPIEDARSAASSLAASDWSGENVDDHVSERYREDCLAGSIVAQDLYPREEIHERVREHCAEQSQELLEVRGIDPEDLEIRYCGIEDGVIAYKATHEDIPEIEYDYLPTQGPNTTVVEGADHAE